MRPYFILLVALWLSDLVMAHEGHDDAPVLPLSTSSLAPRMEAKSADFELVGIVTPNKSILTLYLDIFATNEPVKNAQIEVESGPFKTIARSTESATYVVQAKELVTPGKHEIMFTIQTNKTADLLLGDLIIPQLDVVHDAVKPNSGWLPDLPSTLGPTLMRWYESVSSWITKLLALSWGNGNLKWVLLIGLLPSGLIIFWVRSKKRAAQRPVPTVTVAWLLIILPWLLSTSPRSFAHGGEDHSEAAKTPSSPASSLSTGKVEEMSNNTSIRLPDGSVFVPKPIQHLLGLRTRLVKTTEVAQGIELNNGHIIPDPNYSGVVQAPLAGRIELTESGLPTLGQTVSKGQILAYLIPIASDVDRSNQQVELANLDGQIDIVKKNINRLNKLGNNAAHRDLEDAQLELHSLQTRRQTLGANLSKRIPLMVPLAGVIATSKVLAGQVVDAREILFEIVNPDKFWVEALIYDSALAEQIGTAQALTANQQILSLRLLGLTYRLREHALPLQFRITSPSPLPFLTLEQPVKVFATLKQTFRGMLLPNGAVLKGNDSQSLVWVHDHAEHFKPVTVQVQPADGSQVAVIAGLTEGDRVVTEGATLLGQIR